MSSAQVIKYAIFVKLDQFLSSDLVSASLNADPEPTTQSLTDLEFNHTAENVIHHAQNASGLDLKTA